MMEPAITCMFPQFYPFRGHPLTSPIVVSSTMRLKQPSKRILPSSNTTEHTLEEAPLDLTCKRVSDCPSPDDSIPESIFIPTVDTSNVELVNTVVQDSDSYELSTSPTIKSLRSPSRAKLKRKSLVRPFKAYKVKANSSPPTDCSNCESTRFNLGNNLPAASLPNRPTSPRSRNLSSSVSIVSTASEDQDSEDEGSTSSLSRQNGDNFAGGNPRMKRHPDMTPCEMKDTVYWDRRRKNNEAAKKSRETRRIKEEKMTHHANLIEQDNYRLRGEILAVQAEIDSLQCLVSTSTAS